MVEQSLDEIGLILNKARKLAILYDALTQRPLGITGEVGEFEAVRLLGLQLMPAREPGYDAIDPKTKQRYQIKCRCLMGPSKRGNQRIGQIRLDRKWDALLLVVLDANIKPIVIYEAARTAVRGKCTERNRRLEKRVRLQFPVSEGSLSQCGALNSRQPAETCCREFPFPLKV